jgi:hypothetical protein
MFKKISGASDRTYEMVRENIDSSKNGYLATLDHLSRLKHESKLMKLAREEDRKQLERDQRDAQACKFTKMKKKSPFLPRPAKKHNGFFHHMKTVVQIHD